MTRQEQNALIIEALERGLQLSSDVSENIGRQFKAWVQTKTAAIAGAMSAAQSQQPMPEENSQQGAA